jgi:hypothetical protein
VATTFNAPLLAQRQDQGKRAQTYENSARHARAWGFRYTKGFGEFQHPQYLDFEVAFIGMPTMNYGYALNDVDLVDTRFPRAWGFTHRWRLDGDGNYRGCWVSTVVETYGVTVPTALPDPGYPLVHSFEFNGLAYKALPSRIGADLA